MLNCLIYVFDIENTGCFGLDDMHRCKFEDLVHMLHL